MPDTETTRLLGAINVRPAQQIELASTPLTAVEAAIADGRSRGGIRDLAGWVVYLLRQRRDHGWAPPPPAPRADASEVQGAYFAQRAAEQEREQEAKQADEHPPAPSLAEVYEALAERVGSALDYDIRWQPNEYEPDGFVERVRPLELTNGILVASNCPQCRAQLLANRAEVVCACGQAISLI